MFSMLIISMSMSRSLSIAVNRLGAVLQILGRHSIVPKEKIAM